MEIKLRGEMKIADIRQALFEQLHELETRMRCNSRAALPCKSIRRTVSAMRLSPAWRADGP
jgi:hypothetical protein